MPNAEINIKYQRPRMQRDIYILMESLKFLIYLCYDSNYILSQEKPLQLGVVGRVPANRRVIVRRQTVHILLGQLEVEQLCVFDDTRLGDRLGKRDKSLSNTVSISIIIR